MASINDSATFSMVITKTHYRDHFSPQEIDELRVTAELLGFINKEERLTALCEESIKTKHVNRQNKNKTIAITGTQHLCNTDTQVEAFLDSYLADRYVDGYRIVVCGSSGGTDMIAIKCANKFNAIMTAHGSEPFSIEVYVAVDKHGQLEKMANGINVVGKDVSAASAEEISGSVHICHPTKLHFKARDALILTKAGHVCAILSDKDFWGNSTPTMSTKACINTCKPHVVVGVAGNKKDGYIIGHVSEKEILTHIV
jgi:hypothetical protein